MCRKKLQTDSTITPCVKLTLTIERLLPCNVYFCFLKSFSLFLCVWTCHDGCISKELSQHAILHLSSRCPRTIPPTLVRGRRVTHIHLVTHLLPIISPVLQCIQPADQNIDLVESFFFNLFCFIVCIWVSTPVARTHIHDRITG